MYSSHTYCALKSVILKFGLILGSEPENSYFELALEIMLFCIIVAKMTIRQISEILNIGRYSTYSTSQFFLFRRFSQIW